MPKALPGFNLVENRAYYSGKKSTQESRTSKVSIKALLLLNGYLLRKNASLDP